MSKDKHPLQTTAQFADTWNAFVTQVPPGVHSVTSYVRTSRSFVARITKHLRMQAQLAMDIQDAADIAANFDDKCIRISDANLYLEITGSEYRHADCRVHIPEWNLFLEEEIEPLEEITRLLALGAGYPQTAFPADEQHFFEIHKGPGEAIQHLRARHAAAIDWLLGKYQDDAYDLDFASMRIELGTDVFDGNGRLLACDMRLSDEDLKSFVSEHGEAALRQAYEGFHLFRRIEDFIKGKPIPAKRVNDNCDILTGRVQGRYAITDKVAWDRETFEKVYRPHLSEDPFVRPPSSIDGKSAAVRFLEAKLGLN